MKKCLILIFVFCCLYSDAQYRMSTTSYVNELSSSSSFINYNNTNCVTIQTGLYSSIVGRYGLFVSSCEFNLRRIKFYPNPVITNARLQLDAPSQKYQINVYDILGHKILSMHEYNLKNGVVLNLTSLPTNTYILEVTSKSFRETIKFIKQ